MSLQFNAIPTEIKASAINEYLYFLTKQRNSLSNSYFKQTVYALRLAYRIVGIYDKLILLPSIKRDKTLPVVLSKREMRCILEIPRLLKHRILVGLLYGCGLRCGEARNIKISDLDFDRRMLHVRLSKGKKDRYVPLSIVLIESLKKYLKEEKPKVYLFNGKPRGNAGGDFDSRYSQRGVQWVIKQICKSAGILKNVSVHTLRHTYATHLLEDGLDIISIKELLGHSRIETTMVYLHVARFSRDASFSPLDTLYGLRKPTSTFRCPHVMLE